jgi:uridine phosphorylase
MSKSILPNLKVDSADLSPYAIVCGDPFRTEKFAEKLDDAKELAFNREYRTFVGNYQGTQVTVTSHGVGGPGAAVCFEELIRGGVHTLIRVGTAGAYHEFLPPGNLVVSTATVREEGLTRQLVPLSYPAVADHAVVAALEAAALQRGLARAMAPEALAHEAADAAAAQADAASAGAPASAPRAVASAGPALAYGKGITLTLDAFYQGVEEFPHAKFRKAGVLGVEMENATLFVIASLRGVRAGAIAALDGYAFQDLAATYNPHTDLVQRAVDEEILISLDAVAALAKKDENQD